MKSRCLWNNRRRYCNTFWGIYERRKYSFTPWNSNWAEMYLLIFNFEFWALHLISFLSRDQTPTLVMKSWSRSHSQSFKKLSRQEENSTDCMGNFSSFNLRKCYVTGGQGPGLRGGEYMFHHVCSWFIQHETCWAKYFLFVWIDWALESVTDHTSTHLSLGLLVEWGWGHTPKQAPSSSRC